MSHSVDCVQYILNLSVGLLWCACVCDREGVSLLEQVRAAGWAINQRQSTHHCHLLIGEKKTTKQHWWQKMWINSDLQQGTSTVLVRLYCKQLDILVFLIVVMQLLTATVVCPHSQLQTTHDTKSILHGQRPVFFVSMSFNWKHWHNVYMWNVVPEWVQRSPVEHVEKFTRPSGVNGSALEEGERGLIQHSALDSLEKRDGVQDRHKGKVIV